jgi:hypothetical protein
MTPTGAYWPNLPVGMVVKLEGVCYLCVPSDTLYPAASGTAESYYYGCDQCPAPADCTECSKCLQLFIHNGDGDEIETVKLTCATTVNGFPSWSGGGWTIYYSGDTGVETEPWIASNPSKAYYFTLPDIGSSEDPPTATGCVDQKDDRISKAVTDGSDYDTDILGDVSYDTLSDGCGP